MSVATDHLSNATASRSVQHSRSTAPDIWPSVRVSTVRSLNTKLAVIHWAHRYSRRYALGLVQDIHSTLISMTDKTQGLPDTAL
jgi:hypothetical protein